MMNKVLTSFLAGFLAFAGFAAGPIPWTASQFPQWFAVSPQPVTVTGTTEQLLYQTALPPNFMGTAGQFHISYIADGDGLTTNHTMRFYLGGLGTAIPPTGATALWTNTYQNINTSPGEVYIYPFPGGFSNRVYATSTLNSFLLSTNQVVTVGTQTNGLLFTVTGQCAGATNFMALDALTLEALAQ